MFKKILIYLKNIDWIVMISVSILVVFGAIEIYSIGLGQGGDGLLNFKKQIFFIALGLSVMFFLSFVDFNTLRNYANHLYVLAIIFLGSVLFFGSMIRGTRGWFNLGSFSIQPVEFVKVILIIFLASYFSRKGVSIRPLKHLVVSGATTLLLVILVLLQPDFGSSLMLMMIWIIMILVAGFQRRYLAMILVLAFVSSIFAWNFVFKDYQKERILTFINPTENSLDQGYNVSQAIIAVGSGSLTGRGIGFGSQSQLKFLPEAQTDFIFAVISEELGFLGVTLVITLFVIIYLRLLTISRKINNDYGIFVIILSLGLIFVEMFINIGMNMGIMPVVGISLPFMSYGGSAILSHFILIGIIQNIIIKSKINY